MTDTNSTLSLISIIVAALVALAQIYQIIKQNKKTDAETNKVSGADTTKTYAEAAELTARQNIELRQRVDLLEKRADDKDMVISQLRSEVEELSDKVISKDKRIMELETLTVSQESRIKDLEEEVYYLKNVKGNE